MVQGLKDRLYYYFAEKNWGVRREYGPYVDAHQEEHTAHPWRHRWMLVRLNWHYRVLRRDTWLYAAPPELPGPAPTPAAKAPAKRAPKQKTAARSAPAQRAPDKAHERHLPYLDGAESAISGRRPVTYLAKDLLQYDVVSFDIFDTLILRALAAPADLFMLVGQALRQPEFYRIRTDAEKTARDRAVLLNGNREVTLQDIYAVIEARTGIPAEEGVRAEFEAELACCYANPYMKKVFRLVREAGKPVILVSDMYLPQERMEELLRRCGYGGWERLYISCEYQCSKSSLRLYDHVRRDYRGKRIVHVGDNPRSDVECAKRSGLSAVRYRGVHEIGQPYRADGMSPLIGSAYAGIVNGFLHSGTDVYSPYFEYGYLYGGLYVLGFCSWIRERCKLYGIDKVLFLSRDGTIYQEVFEMLGDDIPHEYFLWSRIANLKYTLSRNREAFLRRVVFNRAVRTEASITVGSLLESLSLGALTGCLRKHRLSANHLVMQENLQVLERFFIDNWDAVEEALRGEKEQVYTYIRQKIGAAKRVALVDVGWMGSGPLGLKYLIEEEFGLDCQAFCLQAASAPPRQQDALPETYDGTVEPYLFSLVMNRENFSTHKYTNRGVNSIFFELFTQAEFPSFSGMTEDGGFRFDIPEVENYAIIREIHSGIRTFCAQYLRRYGDRSCMLHIPGYDAYLPYRMIIRNLKFLREQFGGVTYARGVSGDYETQSLETIADILTGVGFPAN